MANAKNATASDKLYMQLNASELSAIIMKGSPNSNDRDAGFCSGSSEGGDDLSVDHSRINPNSPTDATDTSEDSVEVKVAPISLVSRNKRKSCEPSKVVLERDDTPTAVTAPLKKRIRYTSTADSAVVLTPPAAATPPAQYWHPSQVLPHELMPNPAHVFVRHPGVTTLHRAPAAAAAAAGVAMVEEQQEPLALVLKKPAPPAADNATQLKSTMIAAGGGSANAFSPIKLSRKSDDIEQPATTATTITSMPRPAASVSVASSSNDDCASTSASQHHSNSSRPQQRNYKNMTRERRIEANARERTRVHTISAAYETLRRSVPSYSNAQKLSKLSVLRVACSYILTLSRMAGHDYSEDQSEPSIASCFEAVTATIQTEGKIRKKKDE